MKTKKKVKESLTVANLVESFSIDWLPPCSAGCVRGGGASAQGFLNVQIELVQSLHELVHGFGPGRQQDERRLLKAEGSMNTSGILLLLNPNPYDGKPH